MNAQKFYQKYVEIDVPVDFRPEQDDETGQVIWPSTWTEGTVLRWYAETEYEAFSVIQRGSPVDIRNLDESSEIYRDYCDLLRSQGVNLNAFPVFR